MTAEALFLSGAWQEAYEKALRLLGREAQELEAYRAKEGANPKAVAIREERNAIFRRFADLTEQIIEEQAAQLASAGSARAALSALRREHSILKSYAATKGCDISLLPYLTEKDFR